MKIVCTFNPFILWVELTNVLNVSTEATKEIILEII